MDEVRLFHFHDRSSFLNDANPLAKIAVVLAFSSLLLQPTLSRLAAIAVVCVGSAWAVSLPLWDYKRELRFFFFMGAIMGVTRFIVDRDILQSFLVVLRFALIILIGILFADTTSPDDLSRSLGSFLSHVPRINGYRIASTIELTLAAIPLIFDVAAQVADARSARSDKHFRHPLRRTLSFCVSVFELLLEKAEELESALEARSFDPDAKRMAKPFRMQDGFFLGVAALFSLSIGIMT